MEALRSIASRRRTPEEARHWVKREDPAALPEPPWPARIRRSYALVAAGLPKKNRAQLGLAP